MTGRSAHVRAMTPRARQRYRAQRPTSACPTDWASTLFTQAPCALDSSLSRVESRRHARPSAASAKACGACTIPSRNFISPAVPFACSRPWPPCRTATSVPSCTTISLPSCTLSVTVLHACDPACIGQSVVVLFAPVSPIGRVNARLLAVCCDANARVSSNLPASKSSIKAIRALNRGETLLSRPMPTVAAISLPPFLCPPSRNMARDLESPVHPTVGYLPFPWPSPPSSPAKLPVLPFRQGREVSYAGALDLAAACTSFHAHRSRGRSHHRRPAPLCTPLSSYNDAGVTLVHVPVRAATCLGISRRP